MERKYKQVLIPEELFNEIQGYLEKVKKQPQVIAQQQGGGTSGCGLEVIVRPGPGDVPTMEFNCSGGCGIIDRIFGRSCRKLTPGTGDGGVKVSCACTGGWVDRIFAAK